MAEPARFQGIVRFTAEASLAQHDLDDDVLRIEGRIIGGVLTGDGFVSEDDNAGFIEVYLVQTMQLAADGVSLGEVCRSHSAHLDGVYTALFDSDDELRSELAIAGGWDALLHLHWLETEPKYRNSGVLNQAIETAIRHFCPAGLITAYINVLELTPEEWRQLGFRKIAGSDVVYRDNTSGDPYGHPVADGPA